MIPNRQTVAAFWLASVTACKLAVLFLLIETGHIRPYVGDNAAHFYLPAANHILKSGSFNDRDTFRYSSQAPGYSVFIALAQYISPRRYLDFVVYLQVLLDYCVALLLLSLGHRVSSTEKGFWSGVLWLTFPPANVISTWITSETLFTMLLVLSVVMLIESLVQQRGNGLALAAGLSLGVTTLVRGTTLLLPVFLLAMACWRGIPKCLSKCMLFLVGTYLVILPWTLRNLRVLDEPIIVQTGLGATFLQGSRSEYFTIEGKVRNYPVLISQAAQEGIVEPADRKATSYERWNFKLGLRNYRIRLKENPLSVAPFLLHKFFRLWYGTETGALAKDLSLGLCSLLVVPVAVWQLWKWRENHLLISVILSLLVLYFIGIHVICYPEFRYVMPVYPFLIFSAAHQYTELFKMSRA
jgi:4-amino-4-deoxy-L-arabinose transferase-like glycosyltransferase